MVEDFSLSPILITGAARSGTSMTAGVIHYCGAWGGTMSGPTSYNRKGMFENTKIRNAVVKPILRQMGADPMGQDPLPKIEDFMMFSKLGVENFRKLVLRRIREQGYREGPWFYKGAKMCLMWPLWFRAFPQAKWIIVRRRKKDVIDSCMRTRFMRAFRDEEGWGRWYDHHVECFLQMASSGLKVFYVWPSKMIGNDFSEIKDVVSKLGLDWNEEEILDFVEPSLWKAKKIA